MNGIDRLTTACLRRRHWHAAPAARTTARQSEVSSPSCCGGCRCTRHQTRRTRGVKRHRQVLNVRSALITLAGLLLAPVATTYGDEAKTAFAVVGSTRWSPWVSPVKTAAEDPAAGSRPACSVASPRCFPAVAAAADRGRFLANPKNQHETRRRRQRTHPTGTLTAREPRLNTASASHDGRNLGTRHHRAATHSLSGELIPQEADIPSRHHRNGRTRDSILFQPRLSSTGVTRYYREFTPE